LRPESQESKPQGRDRFTSPGVAAIRFVAQRGILKPVVWSILRVRVKGADRLSKLGSAFIVVANHSSHLDAPLIMCGLPRKHTRFLAAAAAADYFFDVWWRRGLTALFFNAYAVDRSGESKRAGASKGLIRRGVPLLVFPEGTRSRTGEIARFSPGVGGLAISAGVPCVPVAIVGARDAMPHGRSWPIPGRPPVTVVIGEPIAAAKGEGAEAFSNRLATEVRRLYSLGTDGVARIDRTPPAENRGAA
jgi:1-acyl-sn-glycerol-3-phosphate acyltransferase